MKTEQLRDYLQVTEIAARWRLPPHSTALYWAAVKGVLRPCIWVRGEFPEGKPVDGGLEPLLVEGLPVTRSVNAWCYPVWPRQVGAYEIAYQAVCDQSGDAPHYLLLPSELLLSTVLREGVVMADDLRTAEDSLELKAAEDLHGKERLTLYRLLLTSVVNAFGWDPASPRSSAVADLVREAGELGFKVSYNTARQHLQRAWETCPPKTK